MEKVTLFISQFEELVAFFQEVIEIGQSRGEYYEVAPSLWLKKKETDSHNLEIEIEVGESIINIANRYKFYLYRKVRRDALISLKLESEKLLFFEYKSLIFKVKPISQQM